MDQSEQIACLTRDLIALTDRYYDEYDLSYQAVVGVLEIHKAIIIEECVGFSYEVPEEDL